MTADRPNDEPQASPAPDTDPAIDGPAKPRRGRPKGRTARTAPAIELTLAISGTADGDWHAELRQGSTWITRDLPIPTSAVARAVKELHDDLANPINEAIQAARSQHQARVSALEAELEQARKTLAELVD